MIQGKVLRDAMISASNCLSQQKQQVDALNVFPVPDGDTGTNMSMTFSAAARELARLSNPTVTETADTASSALLRGARGNSGVILSLLFRGFSKGLKGKTEANGADFAAALTKGATQVIHAPIFSARETNTYGVTAEALSAAVEALGTPSRYIESFEAIADYLNENATERDMIIIMGAGDITKVIPHLCK